jgi:tRNA 2-thiouridine synthesizing protein B
MLLHTVNKSPHQSDALDSCLRIAAAGSTLLLLEDGVYAAVAGTDSEKQLAVRSDLACFALRSDVAARGLQELLPTHIKLLDYSGFVKLSVECHAVQSWY